MNIKVPLFKIYSDQDDIDSVNEVIRRGSFWAEGPEILKFEEVISNYYDVKHCVVFNSGTAALHGLLIAHGIKNNHEVIVPSFSFISTANSVIFVTAKPKFIDIEKERFGINPDLISSHITNKTKAIIPVHYSGIPCKIDEIKSIAEEKNIIVIEDAAEALGAIHKGKMVGSIGDGAILSFCQNKIISTGEGGAALTNDSQIFNKLIELRSHGRPSKNSNYFNSNKIADYVSLGYNLRMPSMNAALGLSQLKKVDFIINERRKLAKHYHKNLSNVKNIVLPFKNFVESHVFQLFSIIVDNQKLRNNLISYLENNGIMSKIYFDPIHSTHYYKNVLNYKDKLPITEEISKKILSLPIFPGMEIEQVNYVTDIIKSFISK